MAVLSFPVLMFVCVHSLYGSNPDLGGGPFLTYASASLSLASPSVRRLYPKSSKWPPFLSSQILPVTLTSIRGEKKQHQIVGSELTCVSQHRQQCSVWVWALTSNTDPSHLSHLHLTLHTVKWPGKLSIGFALKTGRRLCLQLWC